MAYPSYDSSDLAEFSGRPAVSYSLYADQALSQALLLFKIGTCLVEFPTLELEADLAKMGILSMADSIVLAQSTQKAAASPFSSESIGSYSYSKAAKAVSKGEETGIMWFDLAVKKLTQCNISDGIPTSGGIEMMEHDGFFTSGEHGNTRFLGPADLNTSREWGFDLR